MSASDRALALFSFPGYRTLFGIDQAFIDADRIRDESGCVLRYDRTFMRPLLSFNDADGTRPPPSDDEHGA